MNFPSSNTFRNVQEWLFESLSKKYDPREARNIKRLILEDVTNKDHLKLMVEMPLFTEAQIQKSIFILEKLDSGLPVQYALGYAYFRGLKIKVNDSVLIPRPETEELVSLFKDRIQPDSKVLEVGSGSGCISLSLKNELPRLSITSCDVSESALATAKNNGLSLDLHVQWLKADFLTAHFDTPFDHIVSNPPYISRNETHLVGENVNGHEPDLALYTNDDNGIQFYRSIAERKDELIKPSGFFVGEINENHPNEIVNLFQEFGWNNIEILADLQGKSRFVSAQS